MEGPTQPERLPIELMSAMPVAAAVPARSIVGICQNAWWPLSGAVTAMCGERQSRPVSEHADSHETSGAGQITKCGMVSALERAVRMAANQHHPDHGADIGHRGQQANREVTFHAEALDDAWNPESDGYRGTGATEVDGGKEPHARMLHRFAESVLARTGVAVIRFQIGKDKLLLTLAEPVRLVRLIDDENERQ